MKFLKSIYLATILSMLTACSNVSQQVNSNYPEVPEPVSSSVSEGNSSIDSVSESSLSSDVLDSSEELAPLQTTVSKLLPKAFKQEKFNGEIRVDWYMIIGNGFYYQETYIMTNNTYDFYLGLKNLNISATPEKDHSRYGGDMAIYTFDDIVLKIWSGYLFIEYEDTPYKGDFYKILQNDYNATFSKDIAYYSFRIDAGDLEIKDDNSLSSQEIRTYLSGLQFSLLNDVYVQKDVDIPIKTIRLNNLDALYIYNEKEFSIFTSDRKYSLNDGFSFVSIL